MSCEDAVSVPSSSASATCMVIVNISARRRTGRATRASVWPATYSSTMKIISLSAYLVVVPMLEDLERCSACSCGASHPPRRRLRNGQELQRDLATQLYSSARKTSPIHRRERRQNLLMTNRSPFHLLRRDQEAIIPPQLSPLGIDETSALSSPAMRVDSARKSTSSRKPLEKRRARGRLCASRGWKRSSILCQRQGHGNQCCVLSNEC